MKILEKKSKPRQNTTVSILGTNYTISFEDDVVIGNETYPSWYGACNHFENKIIIRKDLSKGQMEHTIKHEVYHAILGEGGYDNSSEELVDFLARTHSKASKIFKQLGV